MSILTQSGRAAIAASIKEQSLHLAWGSGDASWESSQKVEKVFVKGEIKLEHYPIKDVKVFKGSTVYKPSIDYTVDSNVGVIKYVENSSITAESTVTIEYVKSTPPESITSTKLINEVGRRSIDEVLFCRGDKMENLLLPLDDLNHPTNNLYLKCSFDFTDAANQVIREIGVMVGTKVKKELPPGQRYFESKDIENPGILLVLEHTVPLIRTAATRETFSFVITF
jgi:hypothetical protein